MKYLVLYFASSRPGIGAIALLLSIASQLVSMPTARAESELRTRTAELITAFKSVQACNAVSTGLGPIEARRLLDETISLQQLAADAIEPHRHALSAEQLQRYTEFFQVWLRHAGYSKASRYFCDTTYTIHRVQKEAARSTVEITVASDGEPETIRLSWKRLNGTWRLVDFSLGDSSAVSSYQRAFGAVIKTRGVSGFIDRLSARVSPYELTTHTAQAPIRD